MARSWQYSLYFLSQSFLTYAKDRPSSLILCVPRIEYAYSFVCLGILSSVFKKKYKFGDISHLIGFEVSFFEKGVSRVGYFEDIVDIDNITYAKVILLKKNSGKVRERVFYIKQEFWPLISIYGSGKKNIPASYQPTKIVSSSKKESYGNLDGVIHRKFSDWCLKQSNNFIDLLPEYKNRVMKEMSLNPVNTINFGKLKFGHILRDRINIVNFDHISSSIESVKVMESNPRIFDFIENNKESKKIIILGRNQSSYSEVSSYINDFHSGHQTFNIKRSEDMNAAIMWKCYFRKR